MLVGHYHMVAFTLNSLGVQVEERRRARAGDGRAWRAAPSSSSAPARSPATTRTPPSATAAPSPSPRPAPAPASCAPTATRPAPRRRPPRRAPRAAGPTWWWPTSATRTPAPPWWPRPSRLARARARTAWCSTSASAGAAASRARPPHDWDTVFAVNLRSHFLVAQAAAPHVPEGGSFVFVSSVAGLQPGSRSPAYDASKAGHHRAQPPRGARVRPPRRAVERRGTGPHRHADGPQRHPGPAVAGPHARCRSGGRAPAWEVAEATCFLLSDAASYVTGPGRWRSTAASASSDRTVRPRAGPPRPRTRGSGRTARGRRGCGTPPRSGRRPARPAPGGSPATCSGEPWTARPTSQRGSPT